MLTSINIPTTQHICLIMSFLHVLSIIVFLLFFLTKKNNKSLFRRRFHLRHHVNERLPLSNIQMPLRAEMRQPSKCPTRKTLVQARREEMANTDVPRHEHSDVHQVRPLTGYSYTSVSHRKLIPMLMLLHICSIS